MTVDPPAARPVRVALYLKILAGIEVLLAALLMFAALRSLSVMLFPASDPLKAAHEEWSLLVLMITAPIAASLLLTSVALLRNWRSRWILHAVPPAFVVCAWLVLLWLDRGAH
jgi:hypothetical protein